MNPIITYITTDLTANNNFNYVRAVQGDNQTRYVHITLLDNQIPYNLSDVEPVLRGDKPDGTTIFNHCEISDTGEIIVELTSQILASAGTGKYEIALYKTNGQDEVLTSFPFNIYVSPASFNVDNITSSNEFTELSGIIKNIDTINQNVESAKDSAKNAELSANQAATSAADASESAEQAISSASDALSSSMLSKSWAIGETGMRDDEDTDNAKYYSQLSAEHMDTAKSYMGMTETYKNDTALLKEAASDLADTASDKAADALNYAELSKSYAIGTEGTVREGDATDNSYYYSLQSDNSAKRAESFTCGGTNIRENENFDNAKYYYEQLKQFAQGLNGIIPMGTISFEELNNINNQKIGFMFNISNSFVSDDRFADGGDIYYGAGSNVIYTADGNWDVLAASLLSGIKGNAESEYRQGFVNLTPDNIGAVKKNGDIMTGDLRIESESPSLMVHKNDMGIAQEFKVEEDGSRGIWDSFGKWVVKTDVSGTSTFNGNASTATKADTATKLGTSSVGSGTKPIYLSSGTATASASTVGSSSIPVYLNAGTITSTGKSFSDYMPKSGGTMTGALNLANNVWNLVGDDAYIGDRNLSNRLCIRGKQSSIEGGVAFLCEGYNWKCEAFQDEEGKMFVGSRQNETFVFGTKVHISNVSTSAYVPIIASAFTQNSSEKTKENIELMTEEEARKILNISPVTFDYREQFGGEKNRRGVIAEEVLKIIPSVVNVPEGYSDDDFDLGKGIENKILSVDYSMFVPYLIKMIQLQQDEINELKNTLRECKLFCVNPVD